MREAASCFQPPPSKGKWRSRLIALSMTVVLLLEVFACFLPYRAFAGAEEMKKRVAAPEGWSCG